MGETPFYLSVKSLIRNDDGRYLILRRSGKSKNNPGKWDFPGGKVDAGEAFQDALLREIREETGFNAVLEHFVAAYERELEDRKIVYLFMMGRIESGTLVLSEEHEDHRFLPPEEIMTVDIVPHFTQVIQRCLDQNVLNR